MGTEEQKILSIKVNYEDAIYGIVRYKEKVEELSNAQKKLKDDFKDGKVGYNEYVTTLAAMDEQTKNYKGAIRDLSREVQNNIKVEREQEGSLKALRAELANAQKAYAALSREEREGAKGKELEKHIKSISDEVKQAEENIGLFQRQVGNYENAIKSALGVNSEFATSIMNMSAGGKGLAGVFEGAITSAKAFGSTLMGFMANPIFLSLAGIAGAGVAFKWFFDYNKGIEESTRLTREFLGLTGESLQTVRNEIQATADTYGKDYKETLEAVDVLTSQYGYNAKEALQIVNDGFQSGADLNGDMIAKIKQFAPAFHDANISGKELVATIQQTRSGIFSDDGLNLIQMGSKKIREMSDKTAESLEGIGISSKKVEADLVSGSKSTFDVIKMISTRLKELPQNSQEVGNVLKDVFGKQGANAGLKMIEQLDTMNIDLNKLKDTTGEYGEKMNEQREANEELNNVLSAMFDMSEKGFGEMLVQVKTLAIQGVTRLLKGVISLINYFVDLYNEVLVFRGGVQVVITLIKSMGSVIKGVFNLMIDGAKMAGRAMKGIAEIIEGIATFSWEKIKKGFSTAITGNFTKTLKEGFGDVKAMGKSLADNVVDGVNNTISKRKINHIEIPVHATEVGDSETTTTQGAKANGSKAGKGKSGKKKGKKAKIDKGLSVEAMAKKEEEAIRKAEDLMLQLVEQTAEQRRKVIELQYDRQIEDTKRKLDTEKGLTIKAKDALNEQIVLIEKIKQKKLSEFDSQIKEEAIKREQTYIQNMLASVEKGAQEEYELKVANIEAAYQLEKMAAEKQVLAVEEKEKLIASIEAKYNKEREDAKKEHVNKLIDEQAKAIEERYKAKIAEAEIKALQSGNNNELEVLRLKEEEKFALLNDMRQREGETNAEFLNRKLQAEKDYLEAKQELADKEVAVETAKWEAVATAANAASQLISEMGENSKTAAKAAKVLALGEIAIHTGVALAQGIKQAQAAGPFPANLVAIATTAATIMAGITSAIKTVKSAKFAKGGYVQGAGTETSDSIPAHLSNGESVLTASATRMFAPMLSAFNQIGGGVPIINNVNTSGQQIGEEFLARAFARGMENLPRPVVSVEEINKTSNRVKTIERLSTLK